MEVDWEIYVLINSVGDEPKIYKNPSPNFQECESTE